MARRIINIGSSPNAKDGDIVRDAFNKVNQNFEEIYNEFSSATQDILPSVTNTYNLGSEEKQWNSLFVGISGVSIDGKVLSVNEQGALTVDGTVVATPSGDPAQADWLAVTGPSVILNKPIIPIVPTNVSEFTNDAGYITSASINVIAPDDTEIQGVTTLVVTGDAVSVSSVGNAVTLDITGGANIGDFTFTNSSASVPIDSTITVTTSPSSNLNKESRLTLSPTNTSSLYAANLLELAIDYGSGFEKYWKFLGDGSLEFPDGSRQSTGYVEPTLWDVTPTLGTTTIDLTTAEILSTFIYLNPLENVDLILPNWSEWQAAEFTLVNGNGGSTVTIKDQLGGTVTVLQPNTVKTVASDSFQWRVVGDSGSIDLSSVGQNIVPDVDNTRDLGSPTNQWRHVYTAGGSIYLDNVKLTNVNGKFVAKKVINPGQENEADDPEDSDATSELGGGAGPVQPYLEVTNTPFITQPAILGTPVTVTAAPAGINANFMVTITEGPTLDVGSIIVSNGGSGYIVGQRYRLWNYNIGGPDVASSIDFEVETVGEDGAILTIINAAFVGSASNVPGTYEFVPAELRASVFDEIDIGLTLTRDYQQGIYNSALELEYDNNTYLSPLGTEWNADGWGNLLELGTRSYTTWRQALNNAVGNNIVPAELVMHDIANDKYYKFDFTVWGGNNGGYSYTRTEVTDPNYFRKPHNAELADIIVADDPEGTGIAIARTDGAGIFNLYQEQSFAAESPVGTLWNADGWDDLSNIETRTYSVFDLAANGYNNVLGKKFVMYVASTQKYYAIEFLEWDTTGNNNFAYVRKEIDLTKVNEGIRFADGTTLKSAEGIGRVKLTSPNNRRIEEVHGYNQVSVTGRISTDYTGLSARTTDTNYEIFVQRTPELDAILQPIFSNGGAEISISFDNITFTPSFLSSIQETEYWFYYNNNNSYVPQTEGNNVYIRITTGGDPVVWWNKADLPGGSADFRGAVIDYHAYTGESTIVGSIHIVDDSGEEHISHQEVASGSTDGENDDLWLVQNEGTISYRRIDGESKTLKVQWTAKVFYGSEFWD